MICFHKYTKWSEVMDTSTEHNKIQVKTCKKCGKIKVRYISLFDGTFLSIVSADSINKALIQSCCS